MTPTWPEGARLLLMRHGETYSAHPDAAMASAGEDAELPLTPRGEAQLLEVAAWLAQHPLGAAHSSTFRRARDTARIVTTSHGLDPEPHEALVELPLHPPAGGTFRDVARGYLALARALEERPASELELEDGTTLGGRLDAALATLSRLLVAGPAPLLVVAHGGLNRFLLAHFLGLPLGRALGLEQDFACINVIEFVRGGRAWVRAVNATFHDPLKREGA